MSSLRSQLLSSNDSGWRGIGVEISVLVQSTSLFVAAATADVVAAAGAGTGAKAFAIAVCDVVGIVNKSLLHIVFSTRSI